MTTDSDTPPGIPVALTQRLDRLEAEVAQLRAAGPAEGAWSMPHPAYALALGGAALACAYLGLGLPVHFYQPLFAALALLLGYHRGLWRQVSGPWAWPLVAMNFLLLLAAFELLLGGGVHLPMAWLKLPTLMANPEAANGGWVQRVVPSYSMVWQGVPGVSDWRVDMTRIQALLWVLTLIAALFRFQPFASMTALALVILSIPSYLRFEWDWVILALILGGAALYIQTRPPRPGI